MKHLYAVIKGPFDSKKLWSLISHYGVNLTDLDNVVYVYGDVGLSDACSIIVLCSIFGEYTCEYEGGDLCGTKGSQNPQA